MYFAYGVGIISSYSKGPYGFITQLSSNSNWKHFVDGGVGLVAGSWALKRKKLMEFFWKYLFRKWFFQFHNICQLKFFFKSKQFLWKKNLFLWKKKHFFLGNFLCSNFIFTKSFMVKRFHTDFLKYTKMVEAGHHTGSATHKRVLQAIWKQSNWNLFNCVSWKIHVSHLAVSEWKVSKMAINFAMCCITNCEKKGFRTLCCTIFW